MDRFRKFAGTDGAWLMIGLAVPLFAILLETRGTEEICSPLLPDLPFSPTCYSRQYLQIDCPLCGLTRSIIHLMHGRWQESLRLHRLGWLVLAILVAQIPFRLWKLSRPVVSMPDPSTVAGNRPISGFSAESWFWCGMLVLLALNRISRGLGW